MASSSTSPGELPSVKPPTSLFPRAAGHSYCPSFLSFLDMRPTPSFLELSPPLSPRQRISPAFLVFLLSLLQVLSLPTPACTGDVLSRSSSALQDSSCRASTQLLNSPKPRCLNHNSLLLSSHLVQLLEKLLVFEVSQSPQFHSLPFMPVPFPLILYVNKWNHRKPPGSLLSIPRS